MHKFEHSSESFTTNLIFNQIATQKIVCMEFMELSHSIQIISYLIYRIAEIILETFFQVLY